MKTQHIIVMVLATVATIYIGTGVITRSAGVAGRIGRLVDKASAEAPQSEDDLTQLLSDLESTQAQEQEEAAEIERDPMVPKSTQRRTTSSSTQSAPAQPAVPSVAVTAVIIDENPMAVLTTGGRSITVECYFAGICLGLINLGLLCRTILDAAISEMVAQSIILR